MICLKLNVNKLVRNQFTYPNWTTNSQYKVNSKIIDKNNILVYFDITKGAVKRRISRIFPRYIDCTSRFLWVLGFLKGEGSNSLGKSNYRRFTITNSDPKTIKIFFEEFENRELYFKKNLPNKSIHLIHHLKKKNEVIKYWSYQLEIPTCKFKCFNGKAKTLDYGVCHVYISDVLLRRVIDLIQEKLVLS